MDLCIVPMKPLARAKQRLAPALSAEERRALSLAMLSDVCAAVDGFDAVWVLNSDRDAADVARAAGAEPRPDPTPDGGLNASLDAATGHAVDLGFEGILIVSADVPAATPEEVTAVAGHDGVVIVPDRSGEGTNALWRRPGQVIPAAFGPGSARAHADLATRAGAEVKLLALPGMALDLDRPEDLVAARLHDVGIATRRLLSDLAAKP